MALMLDEEMCIRDRAYAEDKNGNRTIIGSSDDESKVELPIVCLVNGSPDEDVYKRQVQTVSSRMSTISSSCSRSIRGFWVRVSYSMFSKIDVYKRQLWNTISDLCPNNALQSVEFHTSQTHVPFWP